MKLVSGLLGGFNWWLIGGAGAALLATAAWGGFNRYQLVSLRAAVTQAALEAEQEHVRRVEAQQEVIRYANRNLARLGADVAAGAVVAERLRRRVRDILSASPAAAAGSAPASDPQLVCSDLLQRADQRLRALAELADRRAVAGAACERAYDSLNR